MCANGHRASPHGSACQALHFAEGAEASIPPLSPFSWSPEAGCRGILGHTAPAGPFPSELVLPLAKPLHPQLSPGAYGSRVGAGRR